jgi:lysophospholipase L1-like esterase
VTTPAHVVLLGDSILDNAAYTQGAPDVLTHLRSFLPKGWRASLAAEDGSTTNDLARQLARVPADATHLVVSIGGNDALMNRDLLETPVPSTAEALSLFSTRIAAFEKAYRDSIKRVMALERTTIICTIYNGRLEAAEAKLARIALMMFNDAILRTAFEQGLSVIDLRLVCTEPSDYANPIEPSSQGARKIAGAIALALGVAESSALASHVYSGRPHRRV